ncbi:MAG TPA: glycosyltransferase family 4 protein [Jatrophihabitans sp.]|jgi:glycogen(starch) synthase
MVSWEFPPVIVGGLGRHVSDLANALSEQGHDVRVLTRGTARHSVTESVDGVPVTRAADDELDIGLAAESILAWTQAFEHALIRAGLQLLDAWRPDVIHAHDWLVAQTSRTLQGRCGAPLVVTMHATEYGRQQGWLQQPVPRAIHSVERWLCRRADRVIACSRFMADQVAAIVDLAPGSVAIVGNGIDPAQWKPAGADIEAARRRYLTDGATGPLIAFAGRLVHEKGLQELIKALPLLRPDHPGLRAVVVGRGPDEDDQRDRAHRYQVADLISWPGFLRTAELAAVLGAADVVVVPSLYEPFGMVALESQAVGTPVAVSDTGGLRDLVADGRTGVRFASKNPAAIADAVRTLLADPARTATMAATARDHARTRFSHASVASRVAEIYSSVQNAPSSTR